MSYAAIASHNIPKGDHGALPDPSLLETADHPEVAATLGEEDAAPDGNIHVVDRAEAEKLRAGIQQAEQQTEGTSYEVNFVPPPPAEKVDNVKKEVKDVKEDVKEEAREVKKEGKKAVAKGEAEAKELYKEGKAKGKELYEDAREKGEEVLDEAEKEAKKLQKKAAKLDKEARAAARKYPAAATGIVGAVNFAVLATVGLVAYSNWDQPRWDRRAVTAATVGLVAFFGAESALGYWEYQENEHEQGRK